MTVACPLLSVEQNILQRKTNSRRAPDFYDFTITLLVYWRDLASQPFFLIPSFLAMKSDMAFKGVQAILSSSLCLSRDPFCPNIPFKQHTAQGPLDKGENI